MLESLSVKNVALIEEANIQFNDRLNILSGETGSGKSVILDSINFVLGSKADKSMIRFGSQEASVRAEFTVDGDSEAAAVMREMDIDVDDGVIIITRRLAQDGKGGIKINGNTVTASMLKRVASHLVDVHGQSEHFFLLSENNQLRLIDSLCDKPLIALKEQLKELLAKKRDCRAKIQSLGGSEQVRAQKLDLLSYQINEIEGANISVGEYDKLRAKKKIFDNSERVIAAIGAVSEILGGDNGCADMLSTACRQAAGVSDLNEEYAALSERLENISIEVSDLSETVTDILDNFSFDEAEAQAVEERLTVLKSLFKKYGASEQEVLDFLSDAKEKFEALNDATAELERLNTQIDRLNSEIFKVCRQITALRKGVCKNFCSSVIEQLKSLNIPKAEFYVDFEPYSEEQFEVNADGADKICFYFSANKGEPPKPLGKVISGGEMSRFMLAVKTQLKGLNGISTYIFDEIDAGISGVTAMSVAEKFIAISKDTQIIAVSHLPQVCAAADAQYLIAKTETGEGKTVSNIKLLSREERIDELVRLTGSINTSAARAHAEELLKQFGN